MNGPGDAAMRAAAGFDAPSDAASDPASDAAPDGAPRADVHGPPADAVGEVTPEQLAVRLLDDARLGISVVGRIADRFARMMPFPEPPGRWWEAVVGPGDGSTLGDVAAADEGDDAAAGRGAGGELRQRLRDAQLRAERSLDAAFDAMADAVSLCTDLVDRAVSGAGSGAGSGATGPLRAVVAAGGAASAVCWLHNTSGAAAPPLRVHVGELRSTRGAVLGARIVVGPDTVARLEPGQSLGVTIEVRVPTDAVPGTYHGLVFVDGLEDDPLMLTVHVTRADARP